MSSKDLVEAVNAVLIEAWDPIGTQQMNVDSPRDEYASYVSGILDLLAAGADDDRIARHLGELEVRHMAVGPMPIGRRLAVAARLRAAVRERESGAWPVIDGRLTRAPVRRRVRH
jgi:hypothetical protein